MLLDTQIGTTWNDVVLTWLFGSAAAAIGWLVAIVLTPFGDEERRFARYVSVISAFFTGFVASQFKSAIETWLSSGPPIHPLTKARLCTLVVFFICALIVAYVVRRLAR